MRWKVRSIWRCVWEEQKEVMFITWMVSRKMKGRRRWKAERKKKRKQREKKVHLLVFGTVGKFSQQETVIMRMHIEKDKEKLVWLELRKGSDRCLFKIHSCLCSSGAHNPKQQFFFIYIKLMWKYTDMQTSSQFCLRKSLLLQPDMLLFRNSSREPAVKVQVIWYRCTCVNTS